MFVVIVISDYKSGMFVNHPVQNNLLYNKNCNKRNHITVLLRNNYRENVFLSQEIKKQL